MILYIKALGFSAFDTKEKAEVLVSEIVSKPTRKTVSKLEDAEIVVEYYREYGQGFGLLVRGYLNESAELIVQSLIPYSEGEMLIDTHELDVDYDDEADVYIGFCEETRSGTPISFFLQNALDYIETDDDDETYVFGIRLTSYCIEGTVILPIDKDEEDILLEEEEDTIREALLEQARQGDEEAMNLLEEEAIEASDALKERLKSEDILSILEGFFVPIGDNDDIFSVLGYIESIVELTNQKTDEIIYRFKIRCMNIFLDVYVNKVDLVGHPSIGMRFKGTCWLHGKIDFNDPDEDDDEFSKDQLD